MVLSLVTCGARDTPLLDDLRITPFPPHCVLRSAQFVKQDDLLYVRRAGGESLAHHNEDADSAGARRPAYGLPGRRDAYGWQRRLWSWLFCSRQGKRKTQYDGRHVVKWLPTVNWSSGVDGLCRRCGACVSKQVASLHFSNILLASCMRRWNCVHVWWTDCGTNRSVAVNSMSL